MSRPISWLPRLPQIQKRIQESSRPHYETKDIEEIFGIQTRRAQKLMDLMPTTSVGRSQIVLRDDLVSFLDRVHEAGDTRVVLGSLRPTPEPIDRRKLHILVPNDIQPASIQTLPDNIRLSPGRLEIRFDQIDQLASALVSLALVLDQNLDEFSARYEPRPEPSLDDKAAKDDMDALMRELRQMEASRASA